MVEEFEYGDHGYSAYKSPYRDEKPFHPSMSYVAPGARFFHIASRSSVVKIELDDVFKDIRLFELHRVDLEPLTLEKVPAEYRPYPNCLFVS